MLGIEDAVKDSGDVESVGVQNLVPKMPPLNEAVPLTLRARHAPEVWGTAKVLPDYVFAVPPLFGRQRVQESFRRFLDNGVPKGH
jgi:hypothetical protein